MFYALEMVGVEGYQMLLGGGVQIVYIILLKERLFEEQINLIVHGAECLCQRAEKKESAIEWCLP